MSRIRGVTLEDLQAHSNGKCHNNALTDELASILVGPDGFVGKVRSLSSDNANSVNTNWSELLNLQMLSRALYVSIGSVPFEIPLDSGFKILAFHPPHGSFLQQLYSKELGIPLPEAFSHVFMPSSQRENRLCLHPSN